MKIRDIMSSPAITVQPNVSVQEVARIMREHQISGVPVVDSSATLQGLVTEVDLISRNAPVHEPTYFTFLSGVIPLKPGEYREYRERLQQALATNAGELMGVDDLDLVQIAPDAELNEALERMLNPEVTLLAVIQEGSIVGVVTRTDLVRVIEKLELELIDRGDG